MGKLQTFSDAELAALEKAMREYAVNGNVATELSPLLSSPLSSAA